MEIDENLFKSNFEVAFQDESVYILHYNYNFNKIISYGTIKDIKGDTIYHLCNTDKGSGGAPILMISTGKIIGLHSGAITNMNYNMGTFFKSPITQFIYSYKDFIDSQGLSSQNFSYKNRIFTIINNYMNLNNDEINIQNNYKDELNNGQERIEKLEAKIKELNIVLNDKISKANSVISKIYKDLEESKAKLSRFPFELKQGEKLMSIIITSSDKKFIRSIICKNTDHFCDLENKIYQNKNKIFDIGNYFTVNGRNVDESKSLEANQISDNDIIIMNNFKV